MESDLRRWGLWTGIQYAAEGYSPTSTLSQIFSGRSERPGHRILCVDPPAHSKFWEINRSVLLLRRELWEVLVARYALPVKPTGQPYYISELAGFLSVSPNAFVDRLSGAKRGYKRILFGDLALRTAVG